MVVVVMILVVEMFFGPATLTPLDPSAQTCQAQVMLKSH